MLTPEEKTKIEAFVAERDEMLLACDIDRMLAFYAKHNPTSSAFSSREVAEIAMHKASWRQSDGFRNAAIDRSMTVIFCHEHKTYGCVSNRKSMI